MTGTDGAGRSRIFAEHRGGLPGGATTLAVHEIMHSDTLRRQAGLGRGFALLLAIAAKQSVCLGTVGRNAAQWHGNEVDTCEFRLARDAARRPWTAVA